MKLATNSFVPLKNVRIDDGFWGEYQKIARDTIIPYQWDVINDKVPGIEPSHAIENFRIAAGLSEGNFRGMVFQDTDVAKWLEATAYRLSSFPDTELEKTADEVIDIIGQAQEEDGYLDTYFQLVKPEAKFTNLEECHELYTAGHMTEAAVAYYEATGKRKFMDIMCRFIDLIDTKIGPEEGKIHGYPGHPEIELALVRLYRATGNEKYLKLCEYFINQRGTTPNFFEEELKLRRGSSFWSGSKNHVDVGYYQAEKPIRDMKEGVGHSVRMGYLLTGVADLASENGDATLKSAAETLWNNIVNRQMYVTGGVGSQSYGERFTFDYHLPNDTVYAETCASISMVFCAQKMLSMDVDRKYSDVLERMLYNGTISGMSLDGKHFFYTNPLSMWDKATYRSATVGHIQSKRPGWFGCACCPPNLARMIMSVGNYIYSANDDTVFTHLYIGSEAKVNVGGNEITVAQSGNYPWNGKITFKVSEGDYALALRIPGWARSFELTVNGKKENPDVMEGYAYLRGHHCADDEIILNLPMPVEFVEANPLLRYDCGKAALMRGPIVYCIESADNGDDLNAFRLVSPDTFAEADFELFPGAKSLVGSAKRLAAWGADELYRSVKSEEQDAKITAIPYAFWGNREDSREMEVWIRR